MKKLVLSVAMSSLALAACSSGSGGGGSAKPVETDAKKIVISGLSQETEISETEFKELQGNLSNCTSSIFDIMNRGEQFKLESRGNFAGGEVLMKYTATVASSTTSKLVFDQSYDLIQVPGFSGQIYENNRAQSVCEIETRQENSTTTSTTSTCNTVGDLTQAAKDFFATNSEAGKECRYPVGTATATVYSKGTYTLEGGRKINVLITRTNADSFENCEGSAETSVKTASVSVTSKEIKDHKGNQCRGSFVAEHFTAFKGATVVQNSVTSIVKAPAK